MLAKEILTGDVKFAPHSVSCAFAQRVILCIFCLTYYVEDMWIFSSRNETPCILTYIPLSIYNTMLKVFSYSLFFSNKCKILGGVFYGQN